MLLSLFYLSLLAPCTGKYYDLTHTFDNSTVYWPTAQRNRFQLYNVQRAWNSTTERYYEANTFCGAEHGGTHLDAPLHFSYRKKDVSGIPLEDLIGPAYVIDAVEESKKDKDYLITVDHIEKAEKSSGTIPDGAILLLMTGWSKKWPDLKEYLGTETNDTSLLHFPGLHSDAAKWIVNERKVSSVGIDTASIDYGQSVDFKAHTILAKENIPIFENVKGIDQVYKKNVTIYALPMKIRHGSGAPLRIIGVETSSATHVVLSLTIVLSAILAMHLN